MGIRPYFEMGSACFHNIKRQEELIMSDNSRNRPMARLRRMMRVISRPAKRKALPGGLVIYPYRGYGSRHEIFLMGRVFKQPRRSPGSEDTLRDDLADIARRLFRQGVPGVKLRARFNGTEQQAISDRDGYFRFHIRLESPVTQSRALWQTVPIDIV
jgi:hypothetical protein